jgi:hypothetical protein
VTRLANRPAFETTGTSTRVPKFSLICSSRRSKGPATCDSSILTARCFSARDWSM